MKTGIYLLIKSFCAVLFASIICGCTEYPKSEITNQPFVNKTALNMYVGDEAQLTASPSDATFQWSSDNENVVGVSQSGVVRAIAEGLATISVASANDKTNVDVRVRIFIPMIDINLPIQSVELGLGKTVQLWAYPIPEDASEVVFTWASANPAVATVDKNGMIAAIAKGSAYITVKAGNIEKVITVTVVEPVVEPDVPEWYKYDKTGWVVVAVSDEEPSSPGSNIIDGNYENVGNWCSNYNWEGVPNVGAPLPHWIIIDMKEQREVARIMTQRLANGDWTGTKSFQYFVSDDPNPNATTWVKVIEDAFASKNTGWGVAENLLTSDAIAPFSKGKYLKLLLPDSFISGSINNGLIAVCEIDVYGFRYVME